jgi:hypothetical protein
MPDQAKPKVIAFPEKPTMEQILRGRKLIREQATRKK